jgi:hypothetical protein
VTGNALADDQEKYLDAGVDKVLIKPVLEKSLKEVLDTARERWVRLHTSPQKPLNTFTKTN